jgi:hypothetical protein
MKIEHGKYEDQIDIIPTISIYIHWHDWDYDKDKKLWHFHIYIGWIYWRVELQIGKDYAE